MYFEVVHVKYMNKAKPKKKKPLYYNNFSSFFAKEIFSF